MLSDASIEPQAVDQVTYIENDVLHVEVNVGDGTLTVFDKRSGRSFTGLNRYIDSGDVGDAFTYSAPQRDTVIDIAANTPLHVDRVVSDVEQLLTFLQIFRVPRQLTEARDARLPLAAQFVPISIMTTVRLMTGSPRIDIEARVSNNAQDHRLRVHFAAGSGFERAYVDTAFYVAEHKISTGSASADEPPRIEISATQGCFTSLVGTDSGLTIANRGIPEIEIATNGGFVDIAMTLFRSIGWLGPDDLPNRPAHAGHPFEIPGAQCLGEFEFHYSIIPHGPELRTAWTEARNFQTGFQAVATDFHNGVLAPQGNIVLVDKPEFVLTSVKNAEDGTGIVVRGYNETDAAVRVRLTPGFPSQQAKRARPDETPYGKSKMPGAFGQFEFDVDPAEILTVIFYR